MNRKYLVAAVAALTLTSVAACGKSSPSSTGSSGGGSKTTKLTLVQGVANEPFYISMQCGAQQEVAKHPGVTLTTVAPQAWDVAQETTVVNGVAAKKPNGVLIAPVDDTAMTAPIKQLASQGSKIILVDTTLKDQSIGQSRISSDNKAGGVEAAKTLAKLVGDKGKVAAISVPVGTPTTDARIEGFKEEITTNHPNIKLVKVENVADDAAAATSAIQAIIAANPDLSGVFAANLKTGEGSATALKNTNKVGKVNLVEFDASPKQVEDLKLGTVQALIAQEPLEIGAEGVREALAAINGQTVQPTVQTKMVSVTKDNINDPDVSKYLYKATCS